MTWRRLAGATVLVVGLGACAERSGESPATTESMGMARERLVGGSPDRSPDPAIGVLEVTTDAGGNCTVELIAPNVLLTAAHCVCDQRGKFLGDKVQYRFANGPSYDDVADDEWIEIQPKNVHPHPDYADASSDHDIAILVLDKALNVTPLPFNTKPLGADLVGKSVRLVGYGATHFVANENQDDGFGPKRTLTTTVAKVDAKVALIGRAGQAACSGDSGGPALLMIDGVETLIAIDNYSDARVDCSQGEYYRRIDSELAFIQPFLSSAALAASGPTAKDGSSGGASPSDGDSHASKSKPTTKNDAAPIAGGCSVVGGRSAADASFPGALALALALGVVAARRRPRPRLIA